LTTSTSNRTLADVFRRLGPFHRAKLVFLGAAFVSFLLSVSLWFFVDRELGLFVGLWVPAIHSLGTLVLTGERQ
jgi:hypothetical protein